MNFERPSSEKLEKELSSAEKERQSEIGQEIFDLTQLENWLNNYVVAHYPAENEEAPELTLGDVLDETRKKIRSKRATPEDMVNDLKYLTRLNHALAKNERSSPTMEMTLAPENTHEDWSERALSVELRKNMTIEEVVEVLGKRKKELKETLGGQ